MKISDKIKVHMANIASCVQTNREISEALAVKLEENEVWIKTQQDRVTDYAQQLKK